MSIRKKLLIMDTILIFVLIFISVYLMTYVSTISQNEILKEDLIQSVLNISNTLVDENGNIDIAADINYHNDDIYIAVYKKTDDGEYFITGELPSDSSTPSFKNGDIKEVDGYIYYDYYINISSRNTTYIIRGIKCNTTSINTMLIVVALIILPLLTIASIFISFFIFKNALSPITKLTEEVNYISSTTDITKHINIGSKDITIKSLEESFNQMLDRLNEMFKSEEELTSDISHELRTPLAVILGEGEYALECDDNDERIESLKIILKETNKMIHITNELLEFQRMKNHDSIILEKNDVSYILNEMLIPINDKNIKLIKNIEENVCFDINETLFIEMIQNLLDNAVKYGKENGTITLTLKNNIITVSDDGIGISEEDQQKIFMRFYQVDKSRSNKNSLGLGLSFVSEIARLHKATITVRSKLGLGSKFIIDFNKH